MIKIHVSKYKAFAICASFLCLTLQHLQAYTPKSSEYSLLDSIAKSKENSQSTTPKDSVWKEKNLKEVIVKGSNVTHYPDKDVWKITDEMRKNTFDSYDILKKIPGMFYDEILNTLSYNGLNKILILKDGRKKGNDHIGHLANMRFDNVEIYHSPTGRYSDYEIVINFITQKDWLGYDVYASGSGDKTPVTDNDKLKTSLAFDFTHPKYDVAMEYSYKHLGTELQEQTILKENGELNYISPSDRFNERNTRNNSHNAWVDMDYKLNKKHVLSVKYSATWTGERNSTLGTMERLVNSTNVQSLVERRTDSDMDSKQSLISVFYRGNIGKWDITSDVTVDIYKQNQLYGYIEENYKLQTTDYNFDTMNRSDRNAFRFTADAVRKFGKKQNVSLGYEGYWRNYKTRQDNNYDIAENDFSKNRFYGTWRNNVTKALSLEFGLDAEIQKNQSYGMFHRNVSQFLWGGNSEIYWRINPKMRLWILYGNATSYPTLLQRNALPSITDAQTFTMGNPDLKSDMKHRFFTNFSYGPVSFSATYKYSPNSIESVYKHIDGKTCYTYDNVKYYTYSLSAQVDKEFKIGIGKLRGRIICSYAGNGYNMPEENFRTDYIHGSMLCNYSIKQTMFQIQYIQSKYKEAIPNGYAKRGNNYWLFTVAQDFMNRRLTMHLSWVPPLRVGVNRYGWNEVNTPYYYSYNSTDDFRTMKNQISIYVRYRFAKGRKVRKISHSQFSDHEVND